MICTTEEFVKTFRSFSEVTIEKRQKELFLLLRRTNALAIDFKSVPTTSPLEEIFIIYTLQFFEKWSELVSLLKNENPIFVKKILNVKPCLQLISSFNVEELLLLFSGISYNAKLKILNKLPTYLQCSKANDIFKAILDRYNFYLASKILPACTPEFILRTLKTGRWKPTTQQLMQIVSKHPESHSDILNYLMKDKKSCHKVVLNYIAKNNTKLFVTTYKNGEPEKWFGRRRTRNFVKTNIEEVVQKPILYYQFFHKKQLSISVGDYFAGMYYNMFPTTLDKFRLSYDKIIEVLQVLPKHKKKSDTLLDTFYKKYEKSIFDHSEYVTPELLTILSTQQREAILKPEFKGGISEDKWMCFYSTEKSIPFLLGRVSASSDIKNRAGLIELLVETCAINQDAFALTELCSYINSKHRNDHISVRLAFLRSIQKTYGFSNLNESHWSLLNEIVQLFTLNNEHFFYFEEFVKAHVQFRLKNKLSIRNQLRDYVKARYSNYNFLQEVASYEKHCLIGFDEAILEVYTDENDLQIFSVSFLNSLCNWNKRHRKDPFMLQKYSKHMEILRKGLQSENANMYCYNYIVKCCLKQNFGQDLTSFYFTASNTYFDMNVIVAIFKKRPELISNHAEFILKNVRSPDYKFWQFCCNYSHLGIPQKMIEVCLKEIEAKVSDSNIPAYICCLSFLMPSNEFFKLVKSHRKICQSDDKENRTVQKLFGASFKNVSITPNILENILICTDKDPSYYAHGSLRSIIYNVNENSFLTVLSKFSQCSVSVRKLFIHLVLQCLSKADVSNTLNKYFAYDKSISFRKCIFKSYSKFFFQSPNDESFELFKTAAEKVQLNDSRSLDVLIKIDKVASNYFVPYTLVLWDILQNRTLQIRKGTYMTKFLKTITLDRVRLLPASFCISISDEYLFEGSFNAVQKSVQAFVCKFLIIAKYSYVELVFNKLERYIVNDGLQTNRCCLANFIAEYCSVFLDNLCDDKVVFTQFLTLFDSMVKPHDAFDEHSHLHLTLVYLEKPDLKSLSIKLIEHCQILTTDYGLVFVKLYCNKLQFFLSYLFKNENDVTLEENVYVTIQYLIDSKRGNTSCFLLIILLLNLFPPTFDSSKEKYQTVLSILQQQKDRIVRIHLHKHLKNAVVAF